MTEQIKKDLLDVVIIRRILKCVMKGGGHNKVFRSLSAYSYPLHTNAPPDVLTDITEGTVRREKVKIMHEHVSCDIVLYIYAYAFARLLEEPAGKLLWQER